MPIMAVLIAPYLVQAESVPNIISRSSEGLAQSGALNNENRVAIASQIGDIILPVSRRLYRRQVRSGQGFYAELQKTLDNRRSKMSGQLTLREALSIIQPNLIQEQKAMKYMLLFIACIVIVAVAEVDDTSTYYRTGNDVILMRRSQKSMDYETHEESDEESDGITYWRLRSDPNARNHIRREHRGSMLRLKPVSLRSALSIIQPIPVEEGTFWRKLGWVCCI
ncbi:hypothetical protein Tcan_16581 [Toxocara canis]|uniref:Uncharacterized protein n=1 Tax=Toxocara canis TaxID=6265 RepID=A0A0B2VI35_TOXCA|nr:hypothetical protein Tcan_16581 [Toxocara canis]